MLRVLTALAMCLSGSGAVAQTVDDRTTTVGAGDFPAVGVVSVAPSLTCTGTLIEPDLVLTAAHCLLDGNGNRLDPARIVFQAGVFDGHHRAIETAEATATPPDYDLNAPSNQQRLAIDVGLIRLRNPISQRNAGPRDTTALEMADVQVTVVSYGEGRNDTPEITRGCNVLAHSGTLNIMDCAADLGSSGAPIFVDRGGRLEIASVLTGVVENEGQEMIIGAAVGTLLPPLLRQLDAPIIGKFQSANTSVNRITAGDRSGTGARFISADD